MNRWLRNGYLWLSGSRCLLCEAAAPVELPLCDGCWRDLGSAGRSCTRCALPLTHSGICAECQRNPPPFDRAWAALPFQGPARELVHQLKYRGRLAAATVLGHFLARRLVSHARPFPDVVLPVPLHRRRLCSRGYNQAAEIARVVSDLLKVRVNSSLCYRVRYTAPQTSLRDAAKRRHNLARAFAVARPLAGLDIAVLDDVVTSGATVSELARELKRGGATRVEVWSACRASLDRS